MSPYRLKNALLAPYRVLRARFIAHDGGVPPFQRTRPLPDMTAPIPVKSNCPIGCFNHAEYWRILGMGLSR